MTSTAGGPKHYSFDVEDLLRPLTAPLCLMMLATMLLALTIVGAVG
ncbi:hypothetical protein [Auritidibacter sp. NML100628]|nr:hypothetical protein [Auritidibacter sp. NML100628]